MFPVKKKDYTTDAYLRSEWNPLRAHLEFAYFVTIFGYSAPQTDVNA